MVKKDTTKKFTLSEKVRATKLWANLEETLKEPLSEEDKKNLMFVGEYLASRYGDKTEFSAGPSLETADGKVMKSLQKVDDDEGNDVFVENTPKGKVFWICGRHGWFSTKGDESFDLDTRPDLEINPEGPSHWAFYRHQPNGSVIVTRRDDDKMSLSRRAPKKGKKTEKKLTQKQVKEFADEVFAEPLEGLTDEEIDALHGSDVKRLSKLIGTTMRKTKNKKARKSATVAEKFASAVFDGGPLEFVTQKELEAKYGPAMRKARKLLHKELMKNARDSK